MYGVIRERKARFEGEEKGLVLKGDFEGIETFLSRRYRRIFRGEGSAIFEKGRISRYGLFLLHLSILIILLGSLVGLIFGFRGYVFLKKGEEKDSIFTRGRKKQELKLPFLVRCKDFKILFYPTGEPKEYISSIEIWEKGKLAKKKDVVVNAPLKYKGFYIYQASYENERTFFFSVNGKEIELKEKEAYRDGNLAFMVVRYEKNIHNYGEGVLIAYLEKGDIKTGWLLKDVEGKREIFSDGASIRLREVREELYTGLEVTKNPGVPFIWTGFSLLVLGLFFNLFFYERRIFIRKTERGVLLWGSKGRRKELIEREIERLKEEIDASAS